MNYLWLLKEETNRAIPLLEKTEWSETLEYDVIAWPGKPEHIVKVAVEVALSFGKRGHGKADCKYLHIVTGGMMQEPFVLTDDNCQFQPGAVIGFRYKQDCLPVKFGNNCTIRMGTIIYADVVAGDDFQTGHHVMIREHTSFGDHIVVGTNTVIDGNITVGDFVKIESNCYIPTHTTIGSRVFIGPGVVLTNDRYPQKMRDQYRPEGPTIEDGVTLGGGSIVVPGVTIGRGSFVAAGAVVTKDIPPMSFVKGVPGEILPLPEKLREFNIAKNWRKYLER